jgi:hypothetical protein
MQRPILAGFFCLFVFGLVAFLRHPVVYVARNNGGDVVMASYRFSEENFEHSRLEQLRRREKLDQVIAAGKTELEKVVLLRHWVRSQWDTKIPFNYPPWDAMEILDLARSGASRGFCAQYAVVFLQACQAVGLHARYIDLAGHFSTAVWSNDFERWIVMDPTYDCYYERGGLPLQGHELAKAYWSQRVKGIQRVTFDGVRHPVKREDLAVYRLYSIVKVADQLKYPAQLSVNGRPLTLVHESDYRRYPLVGRDQVTVISSFLGWNEPGASERFTDRPLSDDEDDFRYRMNQTMMHVGRVDAIHGRLKIALEAEGAPSFQAFWINVGPPGWMKIEGNRLLWNLTPGRNRLLTRIETKGGWKGPVSELEAYYKPAYLASAQ